MVTFTEPVVKIDPRLLKKHSLEEIQAIVNLYFKDEFKTDDDFVEFGHIDYGDLTKEEQQSIDKFDSSSDRSEFISMKEYLGLNK